MAFRGLGDELGFDPGAQRAQRGPSGAQLGGGVCLGVELGELRGGLQARGSQLPVLELDCEPGHGLAGLDLIEPDPKWPVDPNPHVG